jgi:hypothetical protein
VTKAKVSYGLGLWSGFLKFVIPPATFIDTRRISYHLLIRRSKNYTRSNYGLLNAPKVALTRLDQVRRDDCAPHTFLHFIVFSIMPCNSRSLINTRYVACCLSAGENFHLALAVRRTRPRRSHWCGVVSILDSWSTRVPLKHDECFEMRAQYGIIHCVVPQSA